MSLPPEPESPTPPADAPSAARRRIRVAGGQLQREASDEAVHLSPLTPPPEASPRGAISTGVEGQFMTMRVGPPTAPPVIDSAPGPSPAAFMPAEITGFFRHLHDTAQALSQHIGMLTVGIPGQTTPETEARPLPMRQRRPQRVEASRVNAKRSVRFGGPADAAAPAARAPGEAGSPATEGATSVEAPLDEDQDAADKDPTEASAAADPSVPLSGSVHDLTSGPPPVPFQPRSAYAPAKEGLLPIGGSRPRRWGLVAAAFALGLFGSWILHRLTASAPRPQAPAKDARGAAGSGGVPARPPANPAATARATELVGQALREEKKGDLAKAVELFTEAERVSPDFPGIRYRLALLALRRGEKSKSRALLGRSLESGEEVAAVHNLQSALARLENQPQLGFAELEAATRADPFNPKYYYFWAEALRRAGRLSEAADKLEEALVRTADPTDESLYQFKLRLVKIELNREGEFANDLAARLGGTSIAPPEWLLTEAALAIKRGEYAHAASAIERARALLSPATAAFLMNDQTFRDNAWRAELAPVYAGPLMTTGSSPRPPTVAVPPSSPLPSPAAKPTPTPAAKPTPTAVAPVAVKPAAPSPTPLPSPAVSRPPEPTPAPLATPALPPAIRFRTGGN